MTVATGTVDAVSILRLGHVVVANMTGKGACEIYSRVEGRGWTGLVVVSPY